MGRLDRDQERAGAGAARCARWSSAGRDLHLLCAGKGPDRDAVTALLGDRVSCPGVLDPATLARAYASADSARSRRSSRSCRTPCSRRPSSGLPLVVASGERQRAVRGRGRDRASSRATRRRKRGRRRWSELLRDPARLAAMGREARAWSLAHAPTWREVLADDLLPAWRARAGISIDRSERRDDRRSAETGGRP